MCDAEMFKLFRGNNLVDDNFFKSLEAVLTRQVEQLKSRWVGVSQGE